MPGTTTRTGPSTRAVNAVVLLVGLWLSVSWVLYDDDQVVVDGERHVYVGLLAGSWLVVLAGYQVLLGAGHAASVLTVWTGLALIVLPIALQYGYLDAVELAYANHLVCGVVVLLAGLLVAKRTTPTD